MDDEQRDACLVKIKINVAKTSTDVAWLKWIVGILTVVLAALLGASLPPGLL